MTVFVLILLSYLAYKIRKQQMTIFERLGIPGPKPNFIFGNSIDIAKQGSHQVFPKWTKKYGPIVGFYIGGWPQVLITDLDLIQHVMIKDFHLFRNRQTVVPGGIHPQLQMKNVVVWTHGKLWKYLRSTILSSFSISKLSKMEDLMMNSIEKMITELGHDANCGHDINLRPIAQELSFSTGTNCFLGLNLSLRHSTRESQSFSETCNLRLEKSMLAMAMLLFPSLTFIAYPLRVGWETIRHMMKWSAEGVCCDVARKMIRLRKDAKIESNEVLKSLLDSSNTSSVNSKTQEVSGDTTVEGTKLRVSEEDIISNTLVFLLAAYETTSVTLQFIIGNLVLNQDVQNKLRNQLKEQIDLDGGARNLKTFLKVPLLTHIINETLRMYPPIAPGTSRISEGDYKYKCFRIPKGAGVFIGVSSVHNDPLLWPQPDKFKPERFEEKFNKLAFLPFGAGPRNCVGMQFALMELQLALANLVLQYKFIPGDSTKSKIETIETSMTLSPKNGYSCKVIKIES